MQLVFAKYKSLSWTRWKKSRILVGEMFWNSWLSQSILSLTDTCRNIIFVTPFGVIVETPSAFCQLVIFVTCSQDSTARLNFPSQTIKPNTGGSFHQFKSPDLHLQQTQNEAKQVIFKWIIRPSKKKHMFSWNSLAAGESIQEKSRGGL